MKKYTLRIYIENEFSGLVLNEGIDSGLFTLVRSFKGVGKVLAIYDVLTDCSGLKTLVTLGYPYLPLDNYQDFEITCPVCGERIDDCMILTRYDNNLLGGNDIECNRKNCGFQKSQVKYIK